MPVGILFVRPYFKGQIGDHYSFLVFFPFLPSLAFLFHFCSIRFLNSHRTTCEFPVKDFFPLISSIVQLPVSHVSDIFYLLSQPKISLSSFKRKIKNKKLVYKCWGEMTRKKLAENRCAPVRSLPSTCWDSAYWNVNVTHRDLPFPPRQLRTSVPTLGPKTYLVKF